MINVSEDGVVSTENVVNAEIVDENGQRQSVTIVQTSGDQQVLAEVTREDAGDLAKVEKTEFQIVIGDEENLE